jgi:uncharacterized protein YwqG
MSAMTSWRQPMEALAEEHLPEGIAATWINLLRPAAQLHPTTDATTAVGHLGGEPHLPENVTWPSWNGPLTFIASLDCAQLPPLDLPLPDAGSLLFFYYDGQTDEDIVIGTWEPETQAGARVLYIPPGTPTAPATTPEELERYPHVPLTARLVASEPGPLHPVVQQAFLAPGEEPRSLLDHPVSNEEFLEALEKLRGYHHQVGGYATPIQDEVEYEVLDLDPDLPDDRRHTEAQRWRLLTQIQSDDTADMMWGDAGALYWLIRTEDLTARRFDAAAFTWQCS